MTPIKPTLNRSKGLTPRARPRACEGCPRNAKGIGFVTPSGHSDSRFIVVGQGPDNDSAKQSQSFMEGGYIGRATTERLYRAKVNRSEVIFTDTVWCYLPGAYPNFRAPMDPAVGAIKHCWNAHLGPYLETVHDPDRPKHIITLGNSTLRFFKGLTQKLPAVPHLGTTELEAMPKVKNGTT